MGDLLKVRGLVKTYPGFRLEQVDLAVPEGTVVGFIGANGAGKTTTIKAVLGLIGYDEGEICISGRRVADLSAQEEVAIRQRVGIVFDACSFPGVLTVGEIGVMMAKVYPAWDPRAFETFIGRFGLPASRKVSELSRGMGMKLMFAVALSHGAELLILDEATAGLDPLARDEVLEILRGFMTDDSHGILMSSHITSDLEHIADYIVCIEDGRMIFTLEKDEITDTAGIIRCRMDQLDWLAESGLFGAGDTSGARPVGLSGGGLRYLQHGSTADVLVSNRAAFARAFPDIVVDRASIDEFMALSLKGERR